ncbi:MAG: hypothetical protein EA412_05385 [Chitinophagaceae bacterium]|nr:MAG: hypothetical protein EA412_05385 [Chitinophagaceae bacterium]
MSAGEKKFFTNYARKESFYYLLFDLIANKSLYDIEKLKTALVKKGCKQPLYKLKSYLKSELLDSIIKYEKEKDEQGVLKQLGHISTLISRGLLEMAAKQLEQLKAFVLEKAFNCYLPVIYKHEHNIQSQLYTISPKIFDEYDVYLKNLHKHVEIDRIMYGLSKLHLTHYTIIENPPNESKALELISNDLIKHPAEDESLYVKLTRYRCLSIYNLMLAKIENLLAVNYEALDVLKAYPDVHFHDKYKIKYWQSILSALNNFNRKEMFLRESDYILNELKLAAGDSYMNYVVYLHTRMLKMAVTGEAAEKDELINEYLKNEAKFYFSGKTTFMLYTVFMYAKIDDFDQTVDWLKKLIKACEDNDMQYKIVGMKVVEIWIHFKFGNYRLLNSLQLSLERIMKKHTITSDSYDYMKAGMRKYQNAMNEEEKIQVLLKWKAQFESLPFLDRMHFNTMSFSFSDELNRMLEKAKV